MSISIIWTSNRMGMIDILFHSLAAQSFDLEDVQLILVDEWYEERKKVVEETIEALEWDGFIREDRFVESFRLPSEVIHIPPDEPHDYIDDTHAYNAGLRRADGELVMFLTDGIWLEPKNLEGHWKTYKTMSGISMTGFLDRYKFPSLKKEGEDFRWSAFQEEFTEDAAWWWFNQNEPYYKERKGFDAAVLAKDWDEGGKATELPGDKFYAALNESIPMAVLKEIDGWDEIYSGGYGTNDIDLGMRAQAAGWKFMVNPKSINKKLGGHGISDVIPTKTKKKLRTPDDNNLIWRTEMDKMLRGERTYRANHGCWGR